MYNLLNKKSFLEGQKHEKVLSQLDGINPYDVYKELTIYKRLNVNEKFFTFNKFGENIIKQNNYEKITPIKNIILLAKKLGNLSKYKNFKSFQKGYTSVGNIIAAEFEINCCYLFSTMVNHIDIEFEPLVMVKGRKKLPEAKILLTNNEELFVECKSLKSVGRLEKSRAERLIQKLYPKLKKDLNPKYRLEILFSKLPQRWNGKYIDDMVNSAKVILKDFEYSSKEIVLNFKAHKQTTKIKLSKRIGRIKGVSKIQTFP